MSTQSFDDSGGKDGYDPSSLLKSAVDKSKTKGYPMTSREEKYFYKGKEPRPSGRDERGGDRAVSRAMVDADRSLKGRDRDITDSRRYPSPDVDTRCHLLSLNTSFIISISRYREIDRDMERYADPVLRLLEEDIKRYEFLQRKRELSDLSLQVSGPHLHLFDSLSNSQIIISTPINVSDKP